MLTRTLVPLTLALALGLAGCGRESEENATDENSSSPSQTESSASSEPTESETAAGEGSCSYTEDGSQAAKEVELPPSEPAATGDQSVTISLGQGEVQATLDGSGAPCTVNSFLSLSEQGYFDSTDCHRLTTQGIYVLQCGDPTGTGAGGPGYAFDDELDTAEALEPNPAGGVVYPAGTLAMANAGPGTNGSQFFLVYDDSPLDPAYTVFGTIDEESLATVQKIAEAGTGNGAPDGPPSKPVTIESVSVS